MENYTLRTIQSLAPSSFVVEKYQRGYKWGIQEVEDLLNDINDFKQGFYCLQPIVIKQNDDKDYELIDGQQRLTTTYIISQCLDKKPFNLSYKTRFKSGAFLSNIKSLPILALKDFKRAEINDFWGKYIAGNPENDNVDNYHFFTAYQVISNWFSKLSNEEKTEFEQRFYERTKVIWYEIISSQTPEEIFINFNQGKIHLEQAELIKALFVLQLKEEPNTEVRAFKTNQFAEEWNTIENQLQDDKFWFFVSNDISDKKKANRIDMLFDIVCNRSKNEQNKLYSYSVYLHKLNNGSLSIDDWQEVKNLFNLLYEWYHDRSIYHYLGLLIYLEFKTITEVFAEYKKLKDKDAFGAKLRKWLSEKIKFDDPNSNYNLSNLSYHSYSETFKILVIFNVATYQISDFNYRFPFDKLKNQKWSLEHIHAQKSEDFAKVKELQDWIEDIRLLLSAKEPNSNSNHESIKAQLLELEQSIVSLSENTLIPKEVKPLATEINNLLDKNLNVHNIKNICLLDGPTNSKISNSNFRKKREMILEIDKQGEVEINNEKIKTFIPVCSKNVFLKYYTQDSQTIQFTYWGQTDKVDYEGAIEEVINNYLN